MSNLFSIFDPMSSIMNWSLNWLSSLISIMMIPLIYWILPSRYNFMYNNIMMILFKELKVLLNLNNKNSLIFISLLLFILFNNLMGLFPYIYTSTSHLTLSLSFAFPLWLSFMLYGWINNTQHMFIHLVPQGTPLILMPFMVMIETISNLIRPLTLTIRLTANMISGHLLLTLMGNMGVSLSLWIIFLLIFSQFFLLMLELAVALIQSYVFSILNTLYSSEIN